MKNKEKEEESNRFTYNSDEGLKVLSKEEVLNIFDEKKKETEDKPIKKGDYTQWL